MTNDYGILTDAWRHNLAEIDQCLLWLRLEKAGLARVDVSLRLVMYRNALQRASEAAERLGKDYGINVYGSMKPCIR